MKTGAVGKGNKPFALFYVGAITAQPICLVERKFFLRPLTIGQFPTATTKALKGPCRFDVQHFSI